MSKGALTKERIVSEALREASQHGLEGLSIGGLAAGLGMSKSGLFAHFGSKEELQLSVLQEARARFEREVVGPALAQPRGLARLRRMLEGWLGWATDPSVPGGCIFMAAAKELDDRPGPARDFLVAGEADLMSTLARMARGACAQGELRDDLDAEQFAFSMQGIVLSFSHFHRLLRHRDAEQRARTAFEQLVTANTP